MTSLRELERRKAAATLRQERPRYVAALKGWGIEVGERWSDNRVFDAYWDASVEAKRPAAEARATRLGIPTRTIFGFKRNPIDINWDCTMEEKRRELERTYG